VRQDIGRDRTRPDNSSAILESSLGSSLGSELGRILGWILCGGTGELSPVARPGSGAGGLDLVPVGSLPGGRAVPA